MTSLRSTSANLGANIWQFIVLAVGGTELFLEASDETRSVARHVNGDRHAVADNRGAARWSSAGSGAESRAGRQDQRQPVRPEGRRRQHGGLRDGERRRRR